MIETKKRDFFPQLTSVRFFAALVVILYHYNEEFTPYLPKFLANFVEHGYIGVSFFFILSGFILAANYYDRLLDKTVSKGEFWWARFSRIYPLYILSILVVTPRLFIPSNLDPFPEQSVYAHQHLGQLFVVVVFAFQSFAIPVGGFLNSPAWSISTEVFFYLCLPFLLPLIARIKSSALLAFVGITVLLALVGPYCYHQDIFTVNVPKLGIPYTGPVDFFLNQFVRMSFITRLPEFLSGILGYRIYRELIQDKPVQWHYYLAGLFAIPFFGFLMIEPKENILSTVLYTGQVLGLPFFLFIILSLITSRSKIVGILQQPRWVLLGEASFALYLFHIPIKNFGQLVFLKGFHQNKDNVWLSLVMIVFSVWVSILLFRHFETPCRQYLKTKWSPKSRA